MELKGINKELKQYIKNYCDLIKILFHCIEFLFILQSFRNEANQSKKRIRLNFINNVNI